MDRKIAPPKKVIHSIELIKPIARTLDNGIPFFELNSGSQPVVRIEFIFNAGIRFQKKPLQASFCNSMLIEGTKHLSAQEIAEKFDFYGAFVEPAIDYDRAGITLHCLNKTFKDVYPTLLSLITEPTFPEKILSNNLKNGQQKFIVNNEKVEWLARRHFISELFGKNHPYGQQASLSDYDTISSEDLHAFFKSNYSLGNLTIVASGKFDSSIFDSINASLGQIKIEKTSSPSKLPQVKAHADQLYIQKENAIQSSIRIGSLFVDKHHPDYIGMQVLNTALGGYFGSRLMANIREDKGYTYGIGSGIATMDEASYFFIATEVGSTVCKEALKEIYFETDQLIREEIPEEELNMVRNYMLGSFLRHSDGPFAMADRFKTIYFHHLDYEYYERFIEVVNTITASELRGLANKYLAKENLLEIVVGP